MMITQYYLLQNNITKIIIYAKTTGLPWLSFYTSQSDIILENNIDSNT